MTNVDDPQDYLDDVEAPARPQQKLWVSNWFLNWFLLWVSNWFVIGSCGCLIGSSIGSSKGITTPASPLSNTFNEKLSPPLRTSPPEPQVLCLKMPHFSIQLGH